MRCPACFVPMTRVEEDGLRLATCPECFGTWITGTALIRRMRLDVEAKVDVLGGGSLEDLLEVATESNTKEGLRCPECTKPMGKYRVHPLIPVTIDRCGPCKGVWLDAGELRLIRYLYKEMVTSEDPEIRRKLEKIAGARIGEEAWRARRQQGWEASPHQESGWFPASFDFPSF